MRNSIFKPYISFGSYIWALGMILFAVFLSYDSTNQYWYLGTLLIGFIIATMWCFVFFYTQYRIENQTLFIRGVIKSKQINLEAVSRVERNKVDWLIKNGRLYFWNPYRRGMKLYLNGSEELFINVGEDSGFLKQLLDLNPNIEVK
ncbi:hypothetical protein I6I98_00610 [Sphingobacterium multivorum]|uniref:PH domain-containing protein n=1 Tax=Sphingobacterium multivorum TaxID=28454 RepID=A0ABX7CR55_SPHMU|nr:hypothetical protein [Sphingobacterium multivorum]QQT53810.1 hypothetical protein I6I98_00610 [Sphingobacterium multivorum]